MKQLDQIEKLKKIIPEIEGIDVAILYGSLARKEQNPNSDIDIQLMINHQFDIEQLKISLNKTFSSEIRFLLEIKMRNKLVVYFKTSPKIELAFIHEIAEINRNYAGSEIKDIRDSILYEKNPAKFNLEDYLNFITEEKKQYANDVNSFNALLDKFLYEFENCSSFHRRSDGYKFYYFYNIALHCVVQMNHLLFKEKRFNFLPKYFIPGLGNEDMQKAFYLLNGTLFLPDANEKKRKLLNWLYTILDKSNSPRLEEVKEFCEEIYKRDFFWNFRDTARYNPRIIPGKLFRSATLSMLQRASDFSEVISKHTIHTIIDLRAEREVKELPYSSEHLKEINYVWSPLDPWNQPDWFKASYHYGNNEEIAYRFFAIGCRDEVRRVFHAILKEEEGACVIHCFAGKDRTGIIISIIHLLSGVGLNNLYDDYLASEVDIKRERLELVLDIIREEGGVEAYLTKCELSNDEILNIKKKLFYG